MSAPSGRIALLPSRGMRSRLRFIIAISLAAVLGGALLYVSLGGAMETYTSPAQLLTAPDAEGKTYRLNGNVLGAVPDDAVARARSEEGFRFVVADKTDRTKTVTVVYRGTIPDQLKEWREIVVTGSLDENGVFIAKRDSLLALCPSKFTEAPAETTPR